MTDRYYAAGRGIQGRYPPAIPPVYREFPKYVTGPDGCPTIAQTIEEERRIGWELARNIGREKANAVQRARADNFALELALEIVVLRKRGRSFRGIADVLNKQGISSARGRQWGPSQILRLLQRIQNIVATGGKSEIRRGIS